LYYVYILATQNNAVLYTGVTNNLERRLGEHKSKLIPGFTKKYNVTKLVYFDFTNDVNAAIAQEKRIKGWSRAKKNALIEERNPNWEELGVAEGDSSSLRSSE
jgi:putative endonuclease